ncbi:MAG: HNH endonuclease signature motif containing protein [Rubrivivax sp.]
MPEETEVQTQPEEPSYRSTYRKAAIKHYRALLPAGAPLLCVVCGFGVEAVLEVAHLDQQRSNNHAANLVLLCPNCHKMLDIGLFSQAMVVELRDKRAQPDWGLRMKDAAPKAAATRRKNSIAKKRSAAAKKAWTSRAKPQSDNDGV